MRKLPISQVVNKGIQQLSFLQERDGGFLSFSSTDEHNFTDAITYPTTFLSCFILLETTYLSTTEKLSSLRNKTAKFLLEHKSQYWSWNYWQRNSLQAKELPYPDDLDVTFCALASLFHYDKKIITGDVFAYIVKLLTSTEKKEGGPYRTWLVEKNAPVIWRDVDIAVNSNIAYFLSLHDISLPYLEKYIDEQIKEKKLISPYYPSFYAPIYFLSRFYKGKQKKIITDILWKERDGKGIWENPLKTALATLTLLNFGEAPEKLIDSITYLLDKQRNGLWQAYGFSIDPSQNGKRYFAGSSALTTVFCLEALQKYQFIQQSISKQNQIIEREDIEKKNIYKKITKDVLSHLNASGEEISDNTEMLLQRVLKNDGTQQIALLPYYFYQSLKKKNKKITNSMLVKLGMANILGWIAYTVYDDFLDDEGDPVFLPVATVSLRQLTFIFDTFPLKRKRIQKLFHIFLNIIDNANAWELKNGRIKNGNTTHINFEQLANKSIGHALGPLTLLLLSGYTQESKEFRYIQSFFTHYLVTKQLNDDAHDWEEDLKKGHLTPVVSLVLKRAQEKKIVKKQRYLKEIFWQEIIEEIWILIHFHEKKAKTALRKSAMIIDPTMLESLLEPHVRSADLALEEQKKMTTFLKTYKE